jgi:hypothetical protein
MNAGKLQLLLNEMLIILQYYSNTNNSPGKAFEIIIIIRFRMIIIMIFIFD